MGCPPARRTALGLEPLLLEPAARAPVKKSGSVRLRNGTLPVVGRRGPLGLQGRHAISLGVVGLSSLLAVWVLFRRVAGPTRSFTSFMTGRRTLVAIPSMAHAGWEEASGPGSGSSSPPAVSRSQMGDREILENLRTVYGWRNQDQGAGGNCLFLSIAPQIRAEDLQGLPARSAQWSAAIGPDEVQSWASLPALQRAGALRRIAMVDERDFLASLDELLTRQDPVPKYYRWRARELYKDMAEEFISSGITELASPWLPKWNSGAVYERVRELDRETDDDGVFKFILKHAEEYIRITGREGNWAGSSEIAALANALQRPFQAYGNNWVTQDTVALRSLGADQWEVMPYFEAAPASGGHDGVPVRVFQTNGGGHYQMLAK
mmetsp:Transcript_70391/g.182548  ORF Transcript_70391/g.182548 Transcript_70391/m.182548 type:complete len:378 (+) Transcript_70391:94-1227(+)